MVSSILDTVQQAESAVESYQNGAGPTAGPGTSGGHSECPVPQGPCGGRGQRPPVENVGVNTCVVE